jgi:hypothetical protein
MLKIENSPIFWFPFPALSQQGKQDPKMFHGVQSEWWIVPDLIFF